MNRTIRTIGVVFLFLLFFVIRAFEADLFYDPLITYFQNDYLYTTIPEVNFWHLILNLLFRYTINTLISLGIIGLIFQKKETLKFAGRFYSIAFVLLIITFIFLVRNQFESGYLLPFYVRRFIIHPLFLLLLLPAFYYQKQQKNED